MTKENKKGENSELAEEHVKIAEDLVYEESKSSDPKDRGKENKMKKTILSLEKAESGISELRSAVAMIAIFIIALAGLFLMSPTITGRVAGSEATPQRIGIILLVFALIISIWLSFKNQKRYKDRKKQKNK